MADDFRAPPEDYHPESPPETPYQRAKSEWDSRIGDARQQAYNWRLMALGELPILLVAVLGLIYQSSKSTVKPYVVEVTKEGQVVAVGPALEKNYVPGAPVIQYFLGQFVTKVRSLPLDPVIARKNWFDAYAYLRPQAANKLNAIVDREQPLSRLGQETVSVQVKSVVPLSKDTYQVRWEETTYGKEGVVTSSRRMTGAFTLEFQPPTSEKALQVNPLGLYIRDFNWTAEVG